MTGRPTLGGPPPMMASRRASSSRRPRLPGGLVRLSRWRWMTGPADSSGGAMALTSLESRDGRLIGGVLHREGDARHHEDNALGGGGDALVDDPQEIAEAQAVDRLGMNAGADLVGDDRERAGRTPDQPRKGIGLEEDLFAGVTAEHPVGHPDREAIDDGGIARDRREPLHQFERFLDRRPVAGALRPMPGDARGHVAIARLRGGEERDATMRGLTGYGEAALATSRATADEERRRHARPTLPRRPA